MRRKTHRASRKLSRNRRRNTFKKRKTNRKRGGRPLGSSPEYPPIPYETDRGRHSKGADYGAVTPYSSPNPEDSPGRDKRTPKKRFCDQLKKSQDEFSQLKEELDELSGDLEGTTGKNWKRINNQIKAQKKKLEKAYTFTTRTDSELKEGGIKDIKECDEEIVKRSFKNIPSRGKEYLKKMSLHGKSLQCHDSYKIDEWFERNKSKHPRVTEIIQGEKDTTSYVVNIFPGKETTMRYSELSQIVTKLRKNPNFKGKIQQSFWKTSRFRSKYNNCIDRIKEINEFLTKIKTYQQDIEESDYDTGEKWTEDLNRLLNGDDDVYHLSEVDIEGALIPTLQRKDYMIELAEQVTNRRVSDSDKDEAAYEIYNSLLNNSDKKKKKQKQRPKIKIDEESSRSDLKRADREIMVKFHPDKLDQMVSSDNLTPKEGESLKYIFHNVYTPAKDYLAEKRQ